jgi:hypothetical protein
VDNSRNKNSSNVDLQPLIEMIQNAQNGNEESGRTVLGLISIRLENARADFVRLTEGEIPPRFAELKIELPLLVHLQRILQAVCYAQNDQEVAEALCIAEVTRIRPSSNEERWTHIKQAVAIARRNPILKIADENDLLKVEKKALALF